MFVIYFEGGGEKMAKSKTTTSYRSAVTGKYVSPKYGKTHPKTTVKETNKK